MALIELENMEFHAFHGCFKEERVVGNRFVVNFSFEVNTEKAEKSDNIADTVNYQTVYSIVKEEVAIPSHLLEHLGKRILDRICAQFPEVEKAQVKISKMNPAMGGKMKSVSVTIEQGTKNKE
jgi:7,8-dihydroneopterin aldolase/epimerase/oxygenase